MARRDGQTSGSKKQPNVNDASRGEGSPSLGLQQESGSHIPPFDQVSQAVSELEVLGVPVPTLHESEPELATELLETVSASAIQLHPEEPTETTPASAEALESRDAGPTEHPQTSASTLEDGSADLARANAEPVSAIEDPSASAQDTSDHSDTKPENDTLISLQSAPMSDSTPLKGVISGASTWSGPTPDQAEAFVSPFSLVRTVVEANLSVWSYLQKEREAALAHLQALSSVKSPVDLLGLQAREANRSLQAALDLGQNLVKSGARIVKDPRSAEDKQ